MIATYRKFNFLGELLNLYYFVEMSLQFIFITMRARTLM
uniref:Uncharacterized protein n=1 Tax=Nelumbo nucifera TaxID=4432 RepID=A0A822YMB8_NELNU|nr:TPA_asm: hypothetical protein HUJ06_005974 [Nelumbo nucifera]